VSGVGGVGGGMAGMFSSGMATVHGSLSDSLPIFELVSKYIGDNF